MTCATGPAPLARRSSCGTPDHYGDVIIGLQLPVLSGTFAFQSEYAFVSRSIRRDPPSVMAMMKECGLIVARDGMVIVPEGVM
jgi:hypothetical protein